MLKIIYLVNCKIRICVKYWYKFNSKCCNTCIIYTFASAKYKQINYLWKNRNMKLFRRTLNPF